MCDSTNVFQDQPSGSEESVHAGLLAKVAEAKGRVLVTTFASNAARLQTIGRVATETGRSVCIAGRSLDRILRVAQATGYLQDFPQPIDFEAAMRLPRSEVLVIATGGQGEPRAALGRIASGNHELKLSEGDTVIFSSRIIPGNEVAIGRIMNQLSELGARIVTERQAHVHVSGHPGRPELIEMYNWVRPQIVVPVHGEARHLAEHARLALSHGVEHAVVQENGDVIRLAPGEPQKVDEVRVGRLVLDGDVILPADGATITERRRMGFSGLITVAVPVGEGGKLAGTPLIRPFGIPVEEDRDDFIADATDAASAPTAQPVMRRKCAKRSGSRCAAVRHCGPARSRWSRSCCSRSPDGIHLDRRHLFPVLRLQRLLAAAVRRQDRRGGRNAQGRRAGR